MSLTRKLTSPLTRPVAIASGATAESDNVVLSGGYKSFTPTFVGDKSIKFDGTDDQVLLPVALPSTFSVSFWFKQTDTRNGDYLFDSRNSSDQAFAAWSTYDSGTNSHVITVWCGTTVVGTTKVPVGTWAHVALTKNGNTVSIYVDGVFDNSGTNATFATTTTSDIKVGTRYTGGNAWQGAMDEWAIFSTALTARQVSDLYNNGQPNNLGSEANLSHWFRMGEGKLGTKSDGESNLLFDQGPNGGLGSEKVTNGTFDSDVSGWSAYSGGTVTWNNGTAITGAVGTDDRGGMTQTLTTVTGAVYQVSFNILSRTSTKWEIYNQTGNATLIEGTALGSHSTFFTAAGTSTQFSFYAKQAGTSDGTVAWDNISVKEVQNAGTINGALIKDESTAESVPKKTQNLPSAGSAKSMSFDGSDDVVTATYTPSTIHSTGLTMSFWCKMDNFSGFQIMGNWDDKGIFAGFDNSGRPDAYFGVQNVQKATTDISSYVSVGRWHHICVTASGASGVGTYYVDGVARDTLSYTADASKASITPIAIGALQQDSGLAYYMEGSIDEVAIWDTALDGDAVKALYNAGLPTPVTTKTGAYDIYRDNLKAYYKMGGATVPAADGTSNLLFDQTNPGVGPELVIDNPYVSGSWTTSNTADFGSNFVKFTRPSSGGNLKAGESYLGGAGVRITSAGLTVGATYKVSVDFETDDSDIAVSVNNGSADVVSTSGSGLKVLYFVPTHTNNPVIRTTTVLDANKFAKFSNISIKEINGNTGTISGATIQTEAPKAIYALPPVANTKSLNFDGTNDHLVTQVDSAAQPNNESRYYSWWSKSGTTSTNPVFDHGGENIGAFIFNYSTNRPLLYTAASVFRYWDDNSAQDDGNWHHWVVKIKYNDITGCELWCDGVKQTVNQDNNSGSMNTYTTGIRIGKGGGNYFNGSLDSFSIHEDLDDEAIRALFNRGRPIDISSNHGAYDTYSDKLLHWWRMGDAPVGQLGSSGDVLFQGLSEEDSELITGFTNGSVYPFDTLVTSGRDITSAIETSENLGAAVSNSFPIVTGEVYKVTFNLTYNSGTNTVNVGLRSEATGANVNLSNTYNTNTNGVNEVLLTATGEDSTAHLQFQLGGYSNSVNFSATDISVKRLRGQYIGTEQLTNGDFSSSSNWTLTGTAEITGGVANWPNATNSTIYQNASLQLAGVQAYKLEYDVVTTNGSSGLRLDGGSSAFATVSIPSDTVGKKTVYVVTNGSQAYIMFNNSSAFVGSIDNVSLKPVGGAAVMTNMTTSDIQTDTPY